MEHQRGAVAILGIIMMMLLASLGATLLMLSKTNIQIAANHRDGIAAQYVAEAGIQYAFTRLETDSDFVLKTETATYMVTSARLGPMSTTGKYIVHIGPDPIATNTNVRLITATGIVNEAQRQVFGKAILPIMNEAQPITLILND